LTRQHPSLGSQIASPGGAGYRIGTVYVRLEIDSSERELSESSLLLELGSLLGILEFPIKSALCTGGNEAARHGGGRGCGRER
jgi:hypothetical protein